VARSPSHRLRWYRSECRATLFTMPLTRRSSTESAEMFQRLSEFAETLQYHQTLDALLWDMAESISALLGIEDCVIYLRHQDMLVQAAAYGIKNPTKHTIAEPITIPIGEGIVGTVAHTQTPELIEDTRQDSRYISDQFAGCSELTVPIVFQGTVIGVLDSEADRTHAYSQNDLIIFQAMANVSASRIAWLQGEQQRLKKEKEQVTQHLESLGRLAGGVAHDFNNLLMVVGLNIELAEESEDRLERQEVLDAALQSVKQARGLTQQLMTFARDGEPLRSEVNLADLLQSTLSVLSGYASLRVSHDIADELPTVWADSSQLSQVLQNLLINAAQAVNYTGHVQVSITMKNGASGQQVVVCVQDNGPGIPVGLQHQIFDPYFSTKETGTGLGLATAYWIVHRHGGKLMMSNVEGGGARFVFRLPSLRIRIARSPGSTPVPLPPMHVLILEDESRGTMGLRRLLTRLGHTVLAVHSGAQVVSTWSQYQRNGTPFDLAILDRVHPSGVGGREALALLRGEFPHARAVVMSDHAADVGPADYRLEGFSAQLAKPFRLEELEAVLRMEWSRGDQTAPA
jgi:signal transduction histidine kinase